MTPALNIAPALMVRRDRHEHSAYNGFQWPKAGPVSIYPHETFNANPNECGSGLYGFSCDPNHAPNMTFGWQGDIWRLWVADHAPVICVDGKAKAASGVVLRCGTATEVAAEVTRLGGTVPPPLAQAVDEIMRQGLARIGRAVAIAAFRSSGWPCEGEPSASTLCRFHAHRQAGIAVNEAAEAALHLPDLASDGVKRVLTLGWPLRDAPMMYVASDIPAVHASAYHAAGLTAPEYLAFNHYQVETAVRYAAAKRLRVKVSTLPRTTGRYSVATIIDAWNRGHGTITAVVIDGKAPAAMDRFRTATAIGVYLGRVSGTMPDGWITPADLARFAKRAPDRVGATMRIDWQRIAKRVDAAKKAGAGRADRECHKAEIAIKRAEKVLTSGINARGVALSWGKPSRYEVTCTLPDGREASVTVGSWQWAGRDTLGRLDVIRQARAAAYAVPVMKP